MKNLYLSFFFPFLLDIFFKFQFSSLPYYTLFYLFLQVSLFVSLRILIASCIIESYFLRHIHQKKKNTMFF